MYVESPVDQQPAISNAMHWLDLNGYDLAATMPTRARRRSTTLATTRQNVSAMLGGSHLHSRSSEVAEEGIRAEQQ